MSEDQKSNRTKRSGWKKLVNKFKKSRESQETTANIFDESQSDTTLLNNSSTNTTTTKPKKKFCFKRYYQKLKQKRELSKQKKNKIRSNESEGSINPQATWVSSKSDKSKKRSKRAKRSASNDALESSTSMKRAQTLDQTSTRQSRRKKKEQESAKDQKDKKDKKEDTVNTNTNTTINDESVKTTSLKTPSSKGRARAEAMVRRKQSDVKSKRGGGKEDDLDRSLSRSFQRGLKTFRENRAKEFKSVKTFISRQYNPNTMQKVVKQVEARQQKRHDVVVVNGSSDRPSSSLTATKLHKGDDVFPTKKNRKSNRQQNKSKKEQKSDDPKASEMQAAKLTADGHVLVETNNNNDGELFVAGGRPFWQQVGKGRGSDDDDDDDVTDDELPMNGDIILEVSKGKISLVEMPTTPVLMDPYASFAHLDGHDKMFFTRDLIFSNTVRSMINLNDDNTEVEKKKKHSLKRLVKFGKPDGLNRYRREKNGDFVFDNPEKKKLEKIVE